MRVSSFFKGRLPALALGGFLGGLVGGALGAGGGIIVVFTLDRVLRGTERGTVDVFSTALCVMLPLSLFSFILYLIRGNVSLQGFSPFILPAVLGGVGGALVSRRMGRGAVRKAFAALTVLSGILLLVR